MESQTKIVGLDLLRNPQKTQKKNQRKTQTVKKTNNIIDNDTLEMKFKKHMRKVIDNFKLPLENYEKSDPIKINLESSWYFFSKEHDQK